MNECFLCGRYTQTELHHIFGNSNRKNSTKYKLVVNLCADCHRTGKRAVHTNANVMQSLHEYGQRLAMDNNNWTIEQFRTIFHKSYI